MHPDSVGLLRSLFRLSPLSRLEIPLLSRMITYNIVKEILSRVSP